MNIAKVQSMIMLSTSPNENEARNAAMLACRAIREGKLVLLAPDDPRLSGASSRSSNDSYRRTYTDEEIRRAAEEYTRRQQQEQQRAEQQRREAYQRAKQAASPPPPPAGDKFNRHLRRRITLQFSARCRGCMTSIPDGGQGWWLKNDGCLCDTCQEGA